MDTKTASLILEHIPVFNVIYVVISYLEPEDKEDTREYAITGFYEKCMEIQDADNGLFSACKGGHMDIVKLMIEKGANDWNGGLYEACHGGHMDIVELMIMEGAYDWDGGLREACGGGHMDIIKLMIGEGATNLDIGLCRACESGHMDIAKFMIGKGATECYSCFEPLDQH